MIEQEQPFITLENVSVRLRDRRVLQGADWCIRRAQNWVVWGPNGAGKTTLAQVLTGEAAVVEGAVRRHYESAPDLCQSRPAVAMVSSEQYHRLYQRERLLGEMRHFGGRVLETTAAGDLLQGESPPEPGRREAIEAALRLPPLLSRPLTALSSGEMRRLLLGRALLADPCLLILDEPYNGLDAATRRRLEGLLGVMAARGTQMVLITHRLTEIPADFDHVVQLEQGRLIWQGSKEEFLARVRAPQGGPAALGPARPQAPIRQTGSEPPLVQMKNVSVRFGEKLVLDGIDWTVQADQHWALIGPNGAGKSTLLALITGDQLQAYANEIYLFGRKKGSGESLQEIRRHIGFLGDELQARYQRRMSGLDVVCSGFFDSVGLYRQCTAGQRRRAAEWVRRLGIEALAEKPMAFLSFGQQRLLLIARAVVKTPRLLILDEPCNGLDEAHRRQVLEVLERIGAGGAVRLLYVTHRPEEIPSCVTHRLYLNEGRIEKLEATSRASSGC